MSESATIEFAGVTVATEPSRAVAPHVLVAGGNERSRQIREAQLNDAGCRVSLARTGFEAIVKASCLLPDLILLDDSLANLDCSETGYLLTTCPATSHIPVLRLARGRRIPQRALSRLGRVSV